MKNKQISSLSRRDRQALETRRVEAIKLYQKGYSQYQIAKQFKVSFEAVSNWVEIYGKRGFKGLKSMGKPGPKSKLSEPDKLKIKRAILKGPQAYGYTTGLWTLARIGKVIRKLSQASFKTTHTWRLVISLGFSCQKPQTKTRERDEQAIANWKFKTFPSLKKMGV